MKKYFALISFIAILSFGTACTQITKKIAVDDLLGQYSGTITGVAHWSRLNLGFPDQVIGDQEVTFIDIKQNSGGGLFIDDREGAVIKINNITPASNGAIFNIPSQIINIISEDTPIKCEIIGLNEFSLGESRCDGFYDREYNELSLSFQGTMRPLINNEPIEVSISLVYKFKKVE